LVKGRTKPPGKRPIVDAIKLKIIEKTVKERPANATHWSVRMMAEEIGISHTSVQRIWNAHGLHGCEPAIVDSEAKGGGVCVNTVSIVCNVVPGRSPPSMPKKPPL
jgi:hypothetical protein